MFASVWPVENFERIFGNLWKLSKLLILVCLVCLCIVGVWLKGNSIANCRDVRRLGVGCCALSVLGLLGWTDSPGCGACGLLRASFGVRRICLFAGSRGTEACRGDVWCWFEAVIWGCSRVTHWFFRHISGEVRGWAAVTYRVFFLGAGDAVGVELCPGWAGGISVRRWGGRVDSKSTDRKSVV